MKLGKSGSPDKAHKPVKSLMLRAALYVSLLLVLRVLLAQGTLGRPASVAADAPGLTRALPVLMYHSILRDEARQGKYVVSPAVFYEDLRYLKEHGYTAVFLSEVIDFVDGKGNLPLKPVLITLDDGYYNNLIYALPVLEALDMKAVVSVVGSYSEAFSTVKDPNPNYAYVSFEEIRYLADSGFVEIGNHSYDMHGLAGRQGSGQKKGESAAHYKKAFQADTEKLQALLWDNCGLCPRVYTYPYGVIGANTRAYLEELGFRASLSCYEQGNRITRGESDTLWLLGRFNRPAGESTEAFMRRALEQSADAQAD